MKQNKLCSGKVCINEIMLIILANDDYCKQNFVLSKFFPKHT